MSVRAAEVRTAVAAVLSDHNLRHLVHVGAHEGEEVPHYLRAGIGHVTLVEPIPHLAKGLRRSFWRDPRVTVVEAACADTEGVAMLHIPARTNLASLSDLQGRAIQVRTRRLDDIAPDADAAVVDVQGHELTVLSCAPWSTLRLVVVETCTVDDPTLAPLHDAAVEFMAGRGFAEVASFSRDYDAIQRWAYGRTTTTGGEVRDVVFARAH